MPIYCNNYDINLYQGQSYPPFLDLDYTDVNDEVVDLNGATFEARMQVRRSPLVEEKLVAMSSDYYPKGVVGGGIQDTSLDRDLVYPKGPLVIIWV